MDQINNTTQQSNQAKGYEELKNGFSFGGINARTTPVMFSAKTAPIPGTMANPGHDQGTASTQSQNDYLMSVKRRQNFNSFRNRLSEIGGSTRMFSQGSGYHSNSFGEYSNSMGGNKSGTAPFGGSFSFGQGNQGQFGAAPVNPNDRNMNMGMGESMESISSDHNQALGKRGMLNLSTSVSGSGQGFMQRPQESTGMCLFGQQPLGGTFATQNPFSANANAGSQISGPFGNSFPTQQPMGGIFGGGGAGIQKQSPSTLGQDTSGEKSRLQPPSIFNRPGCSGTFDFGNSKRQLAFPASGGQRSAFANLQPPGATQFGSGMVGQQNAPDRFGKPTMELSAQGLFSQSHQTAQPSAPSGSISLNQVGNQTRGNFLFGGNSLSRPQDNGPQAHTPTAQQPGSGFLKSQPSFGQNLVNMQNEAQPPANFGSSQPAEQNTVGLKSPHTDTFAPHQNTKRKITELDAHDAKSSDRQQTSQTQSLFNIADNTENNTNNPVFPYSNTSVIKPNTEPSSHTQLPPSGIEMDVNASESNNPETRPTPDIMSGSISFQPAAAKNALHPAQAQPTPQTPAAKDISHPTQALHVFHPPAAPDKGLETSFENDADIQIKEDIAKPQENPAKEDTGAGENVFLFGSGSESMKHPAKNLPLAEKDSPHQLFNRPPNEGTTSEISSFSAASTFKPFSGSIVSDKTAAEGEQAAPKTNLFETASTTSQNNSIADQRKAPVDGTSKLEEKRPADDVQATAPDNVGLQDKSSSACPTPPTGADAQKVPASYGDAPQPSILAPPASLGDAQSPLPASARSSAFSFQLTTLPKEHHASGHHPQITPADHQVGHKHSPEGKPSSETSHPKIFAAEPGKKSMFMGKRKSVFANNDRGPSKLSHSKAADSDRYLRGSAEFAPPAKPEPPARTGGKEAVSNIASSKTQDSSAVQSENNTTYKDESKEFSSSIFTDTSILSGDVKMPPSRYSSKRTQAQESKTQAPKSKVGTPFGAYGTLSKPSATGHEPKMPAPESAANRKRNREHLEVKDGASDRDTAGTEIDSRSQDLDGGAPRTSKERKVDRDQSFSLLTTKPSPAFSPESFSTDVLKGCPQDLKKDICGVMFKMTVLNKSIVKMVASYDSKYRLPDYSRSFIDYTSKMLSLKERLAELVSMASPNSVHKADNNLLFEKKLNHENQILYGTNT